MTIDEAISHEERNVEINKLIGEVSECEPTNAIAYHRQLVEWLNELKQLREQTRWIPVSERLPEKTGIYLISIGDLVASKSFDGHNFRTESEVRFIPDAWMPLPEPMRLENE